MKPELIIIHCSATRENVNVTVEQIDQMHKDRGFKRIGYHYYIRKDGSIHKGRNEDEIGAHCSGYNSRSIGICYEGGLDSKGKAKDTRTDKQKQSIIDLVNDICGRWTILEVIGHRDVSPDKNGNGVVDPFERIKECPCYDVRPEFQAFLREVKVALN